MKLSISARNLTLSDTQQERIERRLYFALGRFVSRISAVEVALDDENGPRGGLDKTCRVLVRLDRQKDVIVEGRGDEIVPLVSRTADRAGRAVSRVLDKRKGINRDTPRTLTADPGEPLGP